MASFWVIGGVYADMRFDRTAPGKAEERYGPYDSYDEALVMWQQQARETIDDALARFTIVEERS